MSAPARPPFDPELVSTLIAVGEEMPPSITPDMIAGLRERSVRQAPGPEVDMTLGGVFVEEDHTVPGPDGNAVPLSVWRPVEASPHTGVLYWIHGGGMVGGVHRGPEMPGLLEMAHELDLALVSVDYRLAPEHPDPAPVEDCYAGLVWLAEHALGLGADPGRVVVGGSSAGAGLAAGTCLLARDRGGPAVRAQLLLSPMLDDRNDTVSAHQMVGVGVWDRTANNTGWTALLGERRGGPDVSCYAAPARAQELSGLPPTFLEVGSAETFRDEVVAHASRIWQAGGEAELHVWPGGFHSFANFCPDARLSRDSVVPRVLWLRRILGRTTFTS